MSPPIRIEGGIQTAERTETDRLFSFSPSFVLPNVESEPSLHEEEPGTPTLANMACAICKAGFSKRRLRLRYHCGICERSICASCSPSNVQLEGYSGLQRACAPCISNAAKVPAAQSRLVRLGEQLDALTSCASFGSMKKECNNLEEALDFSESAVAPLEDLRDRLDHEKKHSEKLEAALEAQSYRLAAEKVRLAVVKAHSEKLEKALEETEKRVRAEIEQELKEKAMMKPEDEITCSTCSAEQSLCDSEKQPEDEPHIEEHQAGEDEDEEEVDFYKYYYF